MAAGTPPPSSSEASVAAGGGAIDGDDGSGSGSGHAKKRWGASAGDTEATMSFNDYSERFSLFCFK